MRTILLVLISVILISSCNNEDKNNQILTANETKELLDQNLRKQIVSFKEPLLIDTLNSVYLIPVNQKFLDKTENVADDGVLRLRSSKKSYRNYSSFNNIALYFDKTGNVIQILNERYLINEIDYSCIDNDIIITFSGINEDTNKDKKLNYEDIETFFIYSVNQDKLLKVTEKEMSFISYKFIPETKNLILIFGHDRDANGEFDQKNEPTYVYRFDFDKEELKPVIDSVKMNEIQKNLDGKN
jgi:hypothetical protein